MKKYTKSYVVKEYSDRVIKYEEVEDRDPFNIIDDGYMYCFSFCDVSYIEDDGMLYNSDRYNYSKKVYFGTRYTPLEFARIYGSIYPVLANSFINSNIASICVIRNSDDSCVSLDNGDITYDELFNKKIK